MTKNWPSLSVQTLPDHVAQAILKRIATGELEPGNRLPSQRELAGSMGVGLAVIREAVQRLVALNVLKSTHGSGTVIQPFRWMPLISDPTLFHLAMQRIGIRDLWEARRLLEGQIIRLAAERATAANLAELREILKRADPLPSDYEASQKLNLEFHRALAQAGQNSVLEELLAPLLEIRAEGAAHRFTPEMCRLTWDAHQRIYDAIASGDPAAAELAVQHHFTVGPVALREVDALGHAAMSLLPAKTSRPRRRRG